MSVPYGLIVAASDLLIAASAVEHLQPRIAALTDTDYSELAQLVMRLRALSRKIAEIEQRNLP
jgi:hypothetical protein